MSDWIDGWAKRAARKDSAAEVAELGGINRRDMIKRAGVVGAAVWAVPVIQSVAAPAFAASNQLCPSPTDPAAQCGGPNCTQCNAGKTCANNTDCFSGACVDGVCSRAVVGSVCASNSDCHSNRCTGGVCTGSNYGTSCSANDDCSSGRCQFGYCQRSKLGGQCGSTADCKQDGPTPLECHAGQNICLPFGNPEDGGIVEDLLDVVEHVVDSVTGLL